MDAFLGHSEKPYSFPRSSDLSLTFPSKVPLTENVGSTVSLKHIESGLSLGLLYKGCHGELCGTAGGLVCAIALGMNCNDIRH